MNDDGNGRTAFTTYRVGDIGEDVALALRRVLDAHRERYGGDPAGVVVNKALIGEARRALEDLGLDLPVATTGGCLLGEMWLKVAGDGDGQGGQVGARAGSLMARVEEAREEMTPARARERLRRLGLFEEVAG